MLIYSYINTSGDWKISTSVDLTVYQYGKNFFHNIAHKKYKITSTLSYANTALSQSAFEIFKCYIIKCHHGNVKVVSLMIHCDVIKKLFSGRQPRDLPNFACVFVLGHIV